MKPLPRGTHISVRLAHYSKRNARTLCLEWQGALDKDGYGVASKEGKKCAAHRASYEQAFGEIPNGLCVLHKCDNPRCISPDHLFLGTRHENNTDCANKGRTSNRMGELHHMHKLSEKEVLAIRRDERTQKVIAEEYGVSPSLISHIKRRTAWVHI